MTKPSNPARCLAISASLIAVLAWVACVETPGRAQPAAAPASLPAPRKIHFTQTEEGQKSDAAGKYVIQSPGVIQTNEDGATESDLFRAFTEDLHLSVIEDVKVSAHLSKGESIKPFTLGYSIRGMMFALGDKVAIRLGGGDCRDVVRITPYTVADLPRVPADPRIYPSVPHLNDGKSPRISISLLTNNYSLYGAPSWEWGYHADGTVEPLRISGGHAGEFAPNNVAGSEKLIAKSMLGTAIWLSPFDDDGDSELSAAALGQALGTIYRGAAAATQPSSLDVFVVSDALDYSYTRKPPGDPDLPATRPTPTSHPAIPPGRVDADARIYDDGLRLTPGSGPHIATVFVPQIADHVGEALVRIDKLGKLEVNGQQAPQSGWNAQTLATWLSSQTAPTTKNFAVWLTIEDEKKTTIETLASNVCAIQVAASRALPVDGTMTIFIVLDSLDKVYQAGK